MIKDCSYSFNGFTYSLTNGNFKIESDKNEPNSIFKYYSNTVYNQNALINRYLFLSHPYHLNDSMDCSDLLLDFKNITKEIYLKFYQQYGFTTKHPEVDYDRRFYEDEANNFEEIKLQFWHLFSNGMGVISFTEIPLHILMWSHYATEKGFMVEFDKSEIINNLKKFNDRIRNYVFGPINYCPSIEPIDVFSELFKDSPDLPMLYSMNVKRDAWDYEKEWRLIGFYESLGVPNSLIFPFKDKNGKTERKLYYPSDAVKLIILGKWFLNGSNTEKIIDKGVFELKSSSDLDFIDFIYKNYNDRLAISGEYEKDKKFFRSAEQIEFEKLDCKTFKIKKKGIIYLGEEFK